MSSSSEITEAIEEEVADDGYEEDDELEADVDIRADIAESLSESETSQVEQGETAVNKDKLNLSTFAAIEEFSGALAKNVVEEALLINEIHERDKLNVIERPRLDTAGLLSGNMNGQQRTGKLGGDTNGYDPYLMQKLLRSEPDPSEATIIEHIPESGQYPRLDPEDKHVKEDVDSGIVDNDQNNNQVASTVQEGVEENSLQTIHEDSELEVKTQGEKLEGVAESQPNNTNDIEAAHQADDLKSEKRAKSIKFSEDRDDHDGTHSECTRGRSLANDKDESAFSSSEESEDEVDCCEMTYKEKKAVVLAVRDGDIDLVELLLEKRRAHIDMLWYGETLLMVAIRMNQQQMAEFLIDNDIDLEYETRIVEKDEDGGLTVHKITARQMAFDRGMEDLVELIDYKTNNLFGFIKPKERTIRLRRPRPPTPPTPETVSDDDLSHDPEEDGGGTEHGTMSHKDGSSRKRPKSSRKDSENSMSTFSDEESVHSSETKPKTVSEKTKSHAGSHDDLSQVFGPDEGYETMSPISPACVQAPHRLEHNIVGTREYVSIRGTKSSHLLRAHTAAKRNVVNIADNSNNNKESIGSYGFERKRWTFCKSAPAPKNYSVESIPDSVVRYGLPFVHGSGRKGVRSANDAQRTHKSQPSPITSAYDEVVKVLSSSRLLNENGKSSILPSIHEKTQVYRGNVPKSLNINYIYANRGSANSSRNLSSVPMLRQHGDLLSKRKQRV